MLDSLLFISIRFLDLIDIFLVAFLMYQIYMIIRGTVAINIFVGIFSVYLLWLIVKALNMNLLSTILGQFIGVGVIALIIVFQQELRRFLLMIGTRYIFNRKFSFEQLFSYSHPNIHKFNLKAIITACKRMSKNNTGALIVIATKSELATYTQTGDLLNADISSRLIESIFFKNNPLHDGAVIIIGNKIKAARCVLPLSNRTDLAPNLGLRHRAALGITEVTDALVVTVSEQTGKLSFSKEGELKLNLESVDLNKHLEDSLF